MSNVYDWFQERLEIQAIADYITEHDITDKRKAQKGVWDALSQEEKDAWKMKAIEEFNAQSD